VIVAGTVWKFPQDDINTDQIRRKIYAHLPAREQARHCMESLDPAFAANVRQGDILVAGGNFGCGSSTPAFSAIMALGIAAIVAESFSRIFFRNCISAGLVVTPCPGIVNFVNTGERIEIDTLSGSIRNLGNGNTLAFAPLPEFLRKMAELGGEKAYLMARLGIRDQPSTDRNQESS
jgi:3-isopropylmalate/(R)-2-methylmalate dehydratase small subunit